MDAALGVGEERAFEVDADGLCFVCGCGGFDGVGEGFERAQGGVDGGGDGGGEVVGDAVGGEKRWSLVRSAGVADMTSTPTAPWVWMSRKAAVRVVVSAWRDLGSE